MESVGEIFHHGQSPNYVPDAELLTADMDLDLAAWLSDAGTQVKQDADFLSEFVARHSAEERAGQQYPHLSGAPAVGQPYMMPKDSAKILHQPFPVSAMLHSSYGMSAPLPSPHHAAPHVTPAPVAAAQPIVTPAKAATRALQGMASIDFASSPSSVEDARVSDGEDDYDLGSTASSSRKSVSRAHSTGKSSASVKSFPNGQQDPGRNARLAKENRERKKVYIAGLEDQIKNLNATVRRLEQRLTDSDRQAELLRAENSSLRVAIDHQEALAPVFAALQSVPGLVFSPSNATGEARQACDESAPKRARSGGEAQSPSSLVPLTFMVQLSNAKGSSSS